MDNIICDLFFQYVIIAVGKTSNIINHMCDLYVIVYLGEVSRTFDSLQFRNHTDIFAHEVTFNVLLLKKYDIPLEQMGKIILNDI